MFSEKKCALKNKGVEKYNGKHNLVIECLFLNVMQVQQKIHIQIQGTAHT